MAVEGPAGTAFRSPVLDGFKLPGVSGEFVSLIRALLADAPTALE